MSMSTNNLRTCNRRRYAIASCCPPVLAMLMYFDLLLPTQAQQDVIQLVVTGSDRAIVLFNGERIVLRKDQDSHPTVALVEADSDKAVLQVNGQEIVLETGRVAAPVLSEDPANFGDNEPEETGSTVTLWADDTGFFYANGQVNRRSARFLVDTGANTVTFSSRQADRLGIEYQNGTPGYAATASGITPTMGITLKRLSIEGIALRNIAANVIRGDFPEVPLLGGSFLNKLDMVRSGKKMELRRR